MNVSQMSVAKFQPEYARMEFPYLNDIKNVISIVDVTKMHAAGVTSLLFYSVVPSHARSSCFNSCASRPVQPHRTSGASYIVTHQ